MSGNGIMAGANLMADFMPNTMRQRAQIETQMYVRILAELAMNRFKWVGLPAGVDERHLENTLLRQALCVFYYSKKYERYFAVPGTPSGPINMHNNSTHFRVVAPQLYETLAATRVPVRDENGVVVADENGDPVFIEPECVPIWANYLRVPDWDIIHVYSSRLVEMDKTIDITVLSQRHPFVIACSQEARKSWTEAMRQVQEGQPIIWGTDSFADLVNTGVQSLDVGVDKDLLLNLMMAKSRIWNECMTMLGIDNGNQDKKERMIVDEINANLDQVMSTRMVALKSRQMACDLINDIFDLPEPVSVEWNTEEPKGVQPGMLLPEVGAEYDEEVD